MATDFSPTTGDVTPAYPACVEHGVWTSIPVDPPSGSHRLALKDIDPDESHAVKQRGVLSFHAVGCSGDFKNHLPGLQVAKAMAAQISNPRVSGGRSPAIGRSFFFLLGDVGFKEEGPPDSGGKDQARMLQSQFLFPCTTLRSAIA